MNLFNELKRRNVFRVGIAYLVVAWLVMQVADVVINNIGAPGWLFPSIMLVLGIGFPVVVIFAWAFEMTPEGIKKEKDVDRSQSITPVTGRKLDRAIIAIMALVIVFLVLDRFVLNDSEERPEPVAQTQAPVVEEAVAPPQEKGPSIAVLPFVNMSDDSSNEYFSDGLTETLLHMLAQLPELRVAARTSSFAFKGQNASIEEVATTLGVAHILEGSVQKAGNRVRITAQLIRADDGFHVWSHNYDRTLDDIFAIQDEIANDVARALDASLMGTSSVVLEGVDTRNTEAYDFYLQSLEQQAIFSFSSMANAENLLKNALAIDPDFADAKLALARNYQMKYETGLIDIESAWASTEPLLLQVKEKRPDDLMVRALTLNAQIQGYLPSVDPEIREAVISKLRALLPMLPSDTWIRRVVGKYLMTNDRYDDALQVIQAGLLLDPLSAELHMDLGNAYRALDRLDEAQLAYNRALQLAPESPGIYSRMSGLARQKGDLPNSLKWARKAIEIDPQDHELVADLASRMFSIGLLEEGSRWAKRCYALAPQSSPCRRVQLDEARARNQPDQLLALSRAMLEDDIESRQYGFFAALWT
jgi:TolB-like protein/thioredoxin-like negative regulator of GroEL